jgi:hypothetical protein
MRGGCRPAGACLVYVRAEVEVEIRVKVMDCDRIYENEEEVGEFDLEMVLI